MEGIPFIEADVNDMIVKIRQLECITRIVEKSRQVISEEYVRMTTSHASLPFAAYV